MQIRVTRGMAGMAICLMVLPLALAVDLSLEERIEAQRSIEQVFWNHRIWPAENPEPKPPLSTVVSDEDLRRKVEDYLKKSQALEDYWGRPVTAEQLQAELNRMAARTRDIGMLRELFEALGNDPRMIAETLGRQLLVDRLIRNWYAADSRWHAEIKAKAQEAMATCREVECLQLLGGRYQETEWKLRTERKARRPVEKPETAALLDSGEWKNHLATLGQRFGTAPDALPVGKMGRLEETDTGFVTSLVLRQGAEEVKTATVIWEKTPFETWWKTKGSHLTGQLVEQEGSFSLPALAESGCTDDTWTPLPIGVPDGRNTHSAVWTGTEMIIWGGKNNWIKINTGGRYNPATDTWVATSMRENVPSPREGHSAVWTGTEMIIWGGKRDAELPSSGGRYDPATDRWTPLPEGKNCPTGRIGQTVVWTGSEMIIWGGRSMNGLENTGGRFNPTTGEWVETPTQTGVPLPRIGHTAVWSGSEMIIWGGEGIGTYFNNGGRYNPVKNTWSSVSTGFAVPEGRVGHVAVWTGSEMVIWGGSGGLYLYNNGGHYNPSLDAWSYMGKGADRPEKRYGHTVVWTGTEMIIWGGYNGSDYLCTGGRYNPTTRFWQDVAPEQYLLSPRSYHTAVWTGTEMIIWGGYDYLSHNTGGRYRPDTDSWVATSRGEAPTSRVDFSVIWTGTEMIIWGGTSLDGNENTGSRYNPATDTWVQTSRGTDVPAPRARHSVVWTGQDMVVWGGMFGEDSFLITGGCYTPSTDTWRPTSIGSEAPRHRAYASAVWTGKEMIIWGGYGILDLLNTGSRYNPKTDKWQPMSTIGPVADKRYFHSAVWTGKEMVVWGGFGWDGKNYAELNTGGRYNPTIDMWYSTTLTGDVPTRREGHRAVWTGTEMIIWGGFGWDGDEYDSLNTGARYFPARNAWVATSTSGEVPDSRIEHSAVWTGAEMIVWGGEHDYNQNVNSGGRYDPAADTWKTMSMGYDVPLPRYSHSAIFTGSEMIVWGGLPTTGTGGRYCVGGRVSISLNEGAEFSKNRNTSARILASSSLELAQMCLSEAGSCSKWQKFSAEKNFHLSPSLGLKTVNCWVKTKAGDILPTVSDTIILDTAKPTGGQLTGARQGETLDLSWSGFSDEGSGIVKYLLVRGVGTSPPANCRLETPIYEGEDTAFTDTGLLPAVKYAYRVCPVDKAGNIGPGKTYTAKPLERP